MSIRQATPQHDPSRTEGPESLAALCIRALLDRASLPRHRHSAHVAGLLKLSYHQAHRRMTGSAPWSLEELQGVAAHHGETLVDLFGEQKSADYETALLIAGPLRITCRLLPGQPLAQHRPGDLIAIKGGSEWVVMVAGEAPTPQACTVRRLIIEPKPDRPRRFAILDDDFDVAQGLAVGLEELGFEATAFATGPQLEAALQFDSFDAYVIDWVLANGTAETLVARLRSHSATCPIALLTGVLSLFLTPWALAQSAEYQRILRSKDDAARLSPGSFIESRGANRVFFVDNTSIETGVLNNIFVVQYNAQGRPGIVVAESAYLKIEANGDKFVVLKNGRDYEGTPGKLDFRIIEFDTQKIRIESKEIKASAPNSKQSSTWTLFTQPSAERMAELHWRLALPIAALVLALMAVPLSFVNPRSGASGNLFMAVLIFYLYYSLLSLFQKWTEQGQISPWIGLWPVHIGMITTLLILFSRQLFSFRWLMFARA